MPIVLIGAKVFATQWVVMMWGNVLPIKPLFHDGLTYGILFYVRNQMEIICIKEHV